MESNGQMRRIHVSSETAELLRGHGRGKWLRKRSDLVDAKGKVCHNGTTSCLRTSTAATFEYSSNFLGEDANLRSSD